MRERIRNGRGERPQLPRQGCRKWRAATEPAAKPNTPTAKGEGEGNRVREHLLSHSHSFTLSFPLSFPYRLSYVHTFSIIHDTQTHTPSSSYPSSSTRAVERRVVKHAAVIEALSGDFLTKVFDWGVAHVSWRRRRCGCSWYLKERVGSEKMVRE